jgi:hypothetical protein
VGTSASFQWESDLNFGDLRHFCASPRSFMHADLHFLYAQSDAKDLEAKIFCAVLNNRESTG